MLSKKNRRNKNLRKVKTKFKTYKVGGGIKEEFEASNPKSKIITREDVYTYGLPEKYEGYEMVLNKDVDKSGETVYIPFTILEMLQLSWVSKSYINFQDIESQENKDLINKQINTDIKRGAKIIINGLDVNNSVGDVSGREDEAYIKFIDSQLSSVSKKNKFLIKSFLNQYTLSRCAGIMGLILNGSNPKYIDNPIDVRSINEIIPMTEKIDKNFVTYQKLFPNIGNTQLMIVNANKQNITLDESRFVSLMKLFPVSDPPFKNVGIANVVVYCDFKKDMGFFIWKMLINEEEEEEEEEEEDDGQPRSRLFPAIAIGSLVTTGAVLGTLFGLGIIGGKTKKKRILRKGKNRVKVKTNRKSRKNRKNKN